MNILTFKKAHGNPLREFNNIEEHDEHIIAQHNKVVRPNDKVYFLGDVCFSKKYLPIVARLNGDKVLIKGNHDLLKLNDYIHYFRDIRGCHQFDGLLLTHIPVHVSSLARWPVNVHGHLHANIIQVEGKNDPRYFNVSMEQLDDYTPISLEDLKKESKKRLESSSKI